jgi:chromodomain-helicase-DNA-binding protein 4
MYTGGCMKGGVCMGCMEIAIEPDSANSKRAEDKASATGDVVMPDNDQDTVMKPKPIAEGVSVAPQTDHASIFRCFTCKRVAHYEHLPLPPTLSSDADLDEIVEVYTRSWLCADCSSYTDGVDKVIAWRPYPPNAVEPPHSADESPNYKSQLPREYLVKWMDRSYRRVQWVPHMWLLSTHQGKLRNFFTGGSKVELLKVVEEERNDVVAAAVFEIGDDSRASSAKPGTATPFSPLEANPDAERYIPMSWKTVDRVLDVFLWRPSKRETKSRGGRKDKGKANVVMSDDDMGEIDESAEKERNFAFESGEQPSMKLMESISDWEQRTRETFTIENISQVVWAFFKWNDLGYDEGGRVPLVVISY